MLCDEKEVIDPWQVKRQKKPHRKSDGTNERKVMYSKVRM